MPVPMKIPLHDYQQITRDFMLSHPYCGLFLKMGLGKTSIVLESLYELNPTSHVLIVAPKTIARCTWVNEIRKWNMPIRHMSLIVNEKGRELTKKKYEEIYRQIPSMPPTVFFINRDRIPTLVKYFPGQAWPFRIVILDESQSFKSYSAERFKALKTVRPYIDRLVELTGSPRPKGLEDLWSQIYLLDQGLRLGRNITQFRQFYMEPGLIVNNHPVNWRPKLRGYWSTQPGKQSWDATREVSNQISDIVLSMDNSMLKLPPLTFNPIRIPMDPDELKAYRTFMKDSVLNVNGAKEPVTAANAAVLSAKLAQMASGALYKADTDKTRPDDYWHIHSKKLELCGHIIDDTDGNVIIAYRFHSDLDMLKKYFEQEKIDYKVFDGSPEMELSWNRKEIPVMLIQPASCGFGLNFQEGGSTLVWYSLPWSLEEYEQTNARIYRQGQKDPVIIHQLMTAGTIDAHILKSLEIKDVSQEQMLRAVRYAIDPATIDSAA